MAKLLERVGTDCGQAFTKELDKVVCLQRLIK